MPALNPKDSPYHTLVFALRPDSFLYDAVRRAKSKTLLVAGDQTYLSHPPHLTLYVSAFDEAALENVVERCRNLCASIQRPSLHVTGWHHFSGDVLTGKQTLVCELTDEARSTLRQLQTQLIQSLAELREPHASADRYRPHFGTLSSERQSAVERCGYPFIGDDWIPHVTIASVAADRWERVEHALRDDAPTGEHQADALSIFRLVNDFPTDWQKIAIE